MVAGESPFDQQQFVSNHSLENSSPKMKPEPGISEAGDQPVLSYPPHAPLGQVSGMQQDMRYSQPHQTPALPLLQNPYLPGGYATTAQLSNGAPGRTEPPPKTFHCSTCNKGFARRSDLARHGTYPLRSVSLKPLYLTYPPERIHTGVRPHACDWPGCGKQFIQRSALTVHSRVHTGEKPHMCERCGKVC